MYYEIAVGSPQKRGLLIDTEAFHDVVIAEGGDRAVYRSVYLYDDDALAYRKAHGSLRDYLGMRSIDVIPIDIDKKDNSDEHTLAKTQGVLLELADKGLSKNIQCYFSGTGYHLILHNNVFRFKPSKDLPYIVRETMRRLLDYIDISIYSRSGIYRTEHTLNPKTDLYKIPLSYAEIFKLEPNEIKTLATTRRMDFKYEPLWGEGELEQSVITEVPEIRILSTQVEPSNVATCVQTMLKRGPQEGGRNNTLMRIVSHFYRHGIPSESAKVALLHWNKNSLNPDVVLRKVEDGYRRGYKYGCHDELMAADCNPRCIFFKRKDYLMEVKTAPEMQVSLHERMTTDYSGRTIQLDRQLGIYNKDITIYPGELVTLFGPTGTNKTALAQNIVLGYDAYNDMIKREWQIPTLYLSLELSDWYMHKRNLQIVSNQDKASIQENFESMWDFHSDELSHIVVNTISPDIEQIQKMVKDIQPACVVVDYIDLVAPPKFVRGEYEQIRHVSHSLSSMAVNLDIIIIMISQTSREYSKKEALDLYGGKGSGAIENASRKVLGISGQANEKKREVELFKNTDGELFSTTLEWTPSFRMKRTDVKTYVPVKEKNRITFNDEVSDGK